MSSTNIVWNIGLRPRSRCTSTTSRIRSKGTSLCPYASKQVRQEKINPQWALRVCTSHTGMTFKDMPAYRDVYYAKIDELTESLRTEIDDDDECLNVTAAEEDAAGATPLRVDRHREDLGLVERAAGGGTAWCRPLRRLRR